MNNNNNIYINDDKESISDFFKDSKILVTGATGFLGKVLVEKLLRCCEDIENIYILLRPKRGLETEQRLTELLKNPIFNKLKETNPKALLKLQVVHGDISVPNMGLPKNEIALLQENINFVIHSAATVSFSESLSTAVNLNTIGTKRIVDLCLEMKNLKSLVYVSTAYSNPFRKTVNEEVYKQQYNYKSVIHLVNNFSEDDVNLLSKNIMGDHPNTYTCTKSLAEELILDHSEKIPCCIVRPSIITSAWREPYEGWVDSYAGITGLFMECGRGTLRSVVCNPKCVMDLIPVDVVANTIIAATWQTSLNRPEKMKVYNCTSGSINPIKCYQFQNYANDYFHVCPSKYVMLQPYFQFRRNEFIHSFYALFYHKLPAILFDMYMFLKYRKTGMLRTGRKFWKAMDNIKYFTTKEWNFQTDNMEELVRCVKNNKDCNKFDIDMRSSNGFYWEKYVQNYVMGIRLYLLKDDLKSLPKAKAKLIRLYWIQSFLKMIMMFLFLKSVYHFF
ncbi:putative fatty acyl-CoA reductase CG5065 isoform X2 [Aethina tumida]|nr:putative fatty acyl-CoA reductase CG5065 isoform X2 [Aethina tumida]